MAALWAGLLLDIIIIIVKDQRDVKCHRHRVPPPGDQSDEQNVWFDEETRKQQQRGKWKQGQQSCAQVGLLH